MNTPPIVSPQEWNVARQQLLEKEKELTRPRRARRGRRRMPRMAVEKEYRFEGPDGEASLLDVFEGRRQLIVYRFFYEPGVAGWPESGCPGCSWVADQVTHRPSERPRHDVCARLARPGPTSSAGRRGWAGRSSRGTR